MQQRRAVRAVFLDPAERCRQDNGGRGPTRQGLPREADERFARTDFKEHASGASFGELRDAVGEPHRLPQVPRPIFRILRLFGRDPAAGHIRNEWDAGRMAWKAPNEIGERTNRSVHHRRMKSMRRRQPPTRDAAFAEHFLQCRDRIEWSGNDAEPTSIGGGQRN